MMKKGLFHIHTRHSYDCLMAPAKIVDMAAANYIDYLVISDHDSLQGSIEAREYADKHKLAIEIPIAAEYATDIGDIIVIGIPNQFQKIRDHRELCIAARAHGAVTVLPHPYDGHLLNKVDFDLIDCIEVFNSRSSPTNNQLAAELARRLNKKVIYGCDAHMVKDILNCPFVYSGKSPFEGVPEPLQLKQTSALRKNLSQLIKSIKQRNGRLMLRVLKHMFSTKKN